MRTLTGVRRPLGNATSERALLLLLRLSMAWVFLYAASGHLLIGLSLLTGLMVRVSSAFGIALMLLYWMAHMDFPYVSGTTNFLMDEHIVYALVLGLLIATHAGHILGVDGWACKRPEARKNPWLAWAVA